MVDFHDTPTEAAFRSQVRGFLHDAYDPLRSRINAERPPGSDQHALTPTTRIWFRKLSERGWIAPSWPAEYGGAGMSIMEQFIFNEEMAEARAVRPGIITVQIAGGTIVALGTDEQRKEHLPPILSGEEIVHLQQLVRKVPVADHIIDYAVRLVRSSRPADGVAPDYIGEMVSWGAGPRASQYLVLAGKARAILSGRHSVAIEDIQSVALPVLRHRLVVNFHAEAQDINATTLVERLLADVPTDGNSQD